MISDIKVKVKVEVTLPLTVSRSVNLVVEPHLGLMTKYLLLFDSSGLVFWGALSDERTGLSFVHVAGHCQRSLCQVRVPWDLRLYFTVSDSRLPFSSPPTTRRVTVEVFDPAKVDIRGFPFPCSHNTDRIVNTASNIFYCCVTWLSLG
jgi:hypothetical protein